MALRRLSTVGWSSTSAVVLSRYFAAAVSPSANLQAQDGSIRRTYKTVDVAPHSKKAGFHILLDGRVLRTPRNAPLILPTHSLALAVAAEWEWQSERKVHPSTMPLMTLGATAIDQPKPRVFMIEEMESYIYSDPVLSRDSEAGLQKAQDQVFYPIQAWAEAFLGVRLFLSKGFEGTEHSPETVSRVRHYLESLDPWKLISLHSMVLDCKSLLIGAALFNEKLSVKEALSASRLEEETQMAEWGHVEGGHDIDHSTIYMKLMAASVFCKLLRKSEGVRL